MAQTYNFSVNLIVRGLRYKAYSVPAQMKPCSHDDTDLLLNNWFYQLLDIMIVFEILMFRSSVVQKKAS